MTAALPTDVHPFLTCYALMIPGEPVLSIERFWYVSLDCRGTSCPRMTKGVRAGTLPGGGGPVLRQRDHSVAAPAVAGSSPRFRRVLMGGSALGCHGSLLR